MKVLKMAQKRAAEAKKVAEKRKKEAEKKKKEAEKKKKADEHKKKQEEIEKKREAGEEVEDLPPLEEEPEEEEKEEPVEEKKEEEPESEEEKEEDDAEMKSSVDDAEIAELEKPIKVELDKSAMELTAEDKKVPFRKLTQPDMTTADLASSFGKFTLPTKEEGFLEIKFVWSNQQACEKKLKSWKVTKKSTE